MPVDAPCMGREQVGMGWVDGRKVPGRMSHIRLRPKQQCKASCIALMQRSCFPISSVHQILLSHPLGDPWQPNTSVCAQMLKVKVQQHSTSRVRLLLQLSAVCCHPGPRYLHGVTSNALSPDVAMNLTVVPTWSHALYYKWRVYACQQ